MQSIEGPASKRRKGLDGIAKTKETKEPKETKETKAERTIHELHKFHLIRDCYFAGEVKTNKTGRRFAPLQTAVSDNSRLLLQLSGGGGIPPFGIKTDNEYEDASTSLIFNVENDNEIDALRRLNTAALQLAIANKHIWWPKGITNDQIKDNFASFFTDKKPRANGEGFWSPQVKARIPIDAATGDLKSCHIVDNESCEISFTELPSSSWDTLVMEISGVYFSGKYTWGLAKQLFKLKTATKSTKRTEKNPRLVRFVHSDLFLGKAKAAYTTTGCELAEQSAMDPNYKSLSPTDNESIYVPGYLETVTALNSDLK